MAKLKLHQAVALADGKKKRTEAVKTEIYHTIQRTGDAKNNPMSGIQRTYKPLDETGGEKLPPESSVVQVKAWDCVEKFRSSLEDTWDCLLTQDVANMTAKADIIVEGKTIAKDVPVTHLMWLEKQVVDMGTFIGKLPVLDLQHQWNFDENSDSYASEITETHRTKKIPKVIKKAEATKEHAEQVELFHEDVIVGHWSTRHFSGAIPAKVKNDMISRNQTLLEAIKVARTRANDIEITDQKQAKGLLDFVIGDLKK